MLCSRRYYILNNVIFTKLTGKDFKRDFFLISSHSCLHVSMRRDLWIVLEIFRLGVIEINNLGMSK